MVFLLIYIIIHALYIQILLIYTNTLKIVHAAVFIFLYFLLIEDVI